MAAFGLLPVHIAFLAGAVALVLFGCVGIEEAYREIDVRIFVMIAGVIPLGLAMEKTGTAALLAGHLQTLTDGWSPFAVAEDKGVPKSVRDNPGSARPAYGGRSYTGAK